MKRTIHEVNDNQFRPLAQEPLQDYSVRVGRKLADLNSPRQVPHPDGTVG
jgi:hypothetical protein